MSYYFDSEGNNSSSESPGHVFLANRRDMRHALVPHLRPSHYTCVIYRSVCPNYPLSVSDEGDEIAWAEEFTDKHKKDFPLIPGKGTMCVCRNINQSGDVGVHVVPKLHTRL